MTDDKAPQAAKAAPAPAAEPVAAAAPTVVVQDRPRTSWGRALVIAAVLVGTLLVGGIGGFAAAHALGGPRPPMGIEQGERPGGQQDRPQLGQGGPQQGPQGGPGQGQHDGPRPDQAPPGDGDGDDTPAPDAG